MALTAEQIKEREGKLTASRVACLMRGDRAEIMNLWRDMVGDPEFREKDLSDVWPVQLGAVTENLNLDWYERKWGPIEQRGKVRVGAAEWMGCTLDGWDTSRDIPVECKHVGGFESPDIILARYQPQLHWIGLVCGRRKVAFSVIEGARVPDVEFIDLDKGYSDILLARARSFMEYVWSMQPPFDFPPVVAPGPATKTVDMTGNNKWADQAYEWNQNKFGYKAYNAAKDALKAMVPADVGRAIGHGVDVKRGKDGSLRVYPASKGR